VLNSALIAQPLQLCSISHVPLSYSERRSDANPLENDGDHVFCVTASASPAATAAVGHWIWQGVHTAIWFCGFCSFYTCSNFNRTTVERYFKLRMDLRGYEAQWHSNTAFSPAQVLTTTICIHHLTQASVFPHHICHTFSHNLTHVTYLCINTHFHPYSIHSDAHVHLAFPISKPD
jgi:hypothetical protein